MIFNRKNFQLYINVVVIILHLKDTNQLFISNINKFDNINYLIDSLINLQLISEFDYETILNFTNKTKSNYITSLTIKEKETEITNKEYSDIFNNYLRSAILELMYDKKSWPKIFMEWFNMFFLKRFIFEKLSSSSRIRNGSEPNLAREKAASS